MKRINLLLIGVLLGSTSCQKWLDAKSNIADVTPSKLEDYQAIVDNDFLNNATTPGIAMTSTDNFYITYATWQARGTTERNAYIWASDIYEGASPQDWSRPYKIVECANIVLDGINTIPVTDKNQVKWNIVKGGALFMRAMSYYYLSQIFMPPYNAATAANDLGIPLRETTDVNVVSIRASVKDTYDKMTTDLLAASDLLPVTPAYQTGASKPAAYALLARLYLDMGDYNSAQVYADKSLALYKTLVDFNTLSTTGSVPFAAYPGNAEVIYYSTAALPTAFTNTNPVTDSVLYQSYATNDLRKTVLYKINAGLPLFKGSYAGTTNSAFSGIATNELYLIRAEAYARLGNTAAALSDLNTLLAKRWKTGTFVAFTATSADDALAKIIVERRKEIPFNAVTRWEDLRRLNPDPRFATTLTRQLNGVIYTLLPNDKKYVFPLPDDEIRLSGLQQNIR